MIRFFILTAITFISHQLLSAQSYEFSLNSGYTFGDRFDVTGGRGKIEEGHTYGASFTYLPDDDLGIEILFTRQDTRGRVNSSFLGLNIDEPIAVNYLLVGGTKMYHLNDKASFFSGLKIGAVVISSKRDAFNNITRFAAGFNGGFKYLFTEQFGFRAQANLSLPITDVGGYLFWNPSTGTSVGVTTATPIVQLGFLGGFYFKLK
jgi:hypothetical protein